MASGRGGRRDRRCRPGDRDPARVAMTALEASIGSLNDLVDAPRDVGSSPGSRCQAGGCRARSPGRKWGTGPSSAWPCPGTGSRHGPRSGRAGDRLRLELAFKGAVCSWLPSRSGFHCCRSTAGSVRPAVCPGHWFVLFPVAVLAGAGLARRQCPGRRGRTPPPAGTRWQLRLGVGRRVGRGGDPVGRSRRGRDDARGGGGRARRAGPGVGAADRDRGHRGRPRVRTSADAARRERSWGSMDRRRLAGGCVAGWRPAG